jgi:UDP-glucose 4-epimerase
MNSRRVLVTGLSTYWGGRLAQALERDSRIEAIIGVDSEDPRSELERTEFVRVGTQHALIRRVVEAAEIDTIVDTRLVVDSATTTPRLAHENNVIGTMNILAACTGPDSTVRKFVFKSSAHFYGAEQDDPAFFEETMGRPHPPRTPIERDIVEAEAAVTDFADHNPDVSVTLLRFANVLGSDVQTSHIQLFSLPAVPMILGFDPRYQFVHEDDVVHVLEHVVQRELPGLFNVAGDGVLALSEIAGLLGKPYAPILPPWGTGLAAAVLRRLGLKIPPEMMQQLRFGRGLDNRRLKAAGFSYGYTSREAVSKLGEHMRLHPLLKGVREPYRYEREVEEFLRWSPNVRNTGSRRPALSARQLVELQKLLSAYPGAAAQAAGRREPEAERAAAPEGEAAAGGDVEPAVAPRAERASAPLEAQPAAAPGPSAAAPVQHYDDLESEEIIALLGSLEEHDLGALRDYERERRGRESVLGAIDSVLARRESGVRG